MMEVSLGSRRLKRILELIGGGVWLEKGLLSVDR